MLQGQGLKVALISLAALALGVATVYFQPKVNHDGPMIAAICGLFQCVLTLWACFIIARSKGLSSNWGFIGLIGLFGVAILLFIPAKQREAADKHPDSTN